MKNTTGLDIMKMLGTILGPTIQSAISNNATEDKVGDYIQLQENRRAETSNIIENPDVAITRDNINIARAQNKADSNILANIVAGLGTAVGTYGNNFAPKFNEGGDMRNNVTENILQGLMRNGNPQGVSVENAPKPATVEGGELIDRAFGGLEGVVGPSHEQGGVPTSLVPTTDTQQGDVVYSKDLSKDGKSMAERKLQREKQLAKLEKQLKKNPTDTLLKQTIERLKLQMEAEDKKDVALQNAAREIYSNNQENQLKAPEFATGGTYGTDPNEMVNLILKTFGDLNASATTPAADKNSLNNFGNSNANINAMKSVSNLSQKDIEKIGENKDTKKKEKNLEFNLENTPTTGDLLGIFGNYNNSVSSLQLAQAQRSADSPNRNFQDGLTEEMDKRYADLSALLRQENALANKDLDANFRAAMANTNNTARSAATKNALNTLALLVGNEAKEKNLQGLLNSLYGLGNAQTQTALATEQAERKGEETRFENDIKDRDNYYSRIQQGLLDFGKGTSTIGKNVNDIKERGVNAKMMNALGTYVGIDFNTGEIIYKNNQPVNPEVFTLLGTTKEAFEKLSKEEQNKLIEAKRNEILLDTK
ncbi:MAG: hypothetical protein E6R13_08685 [Spirochaetes bacterium]|nr:MAG: hypothetical protein E6R13_08685 [Spirochaetota bacterium]